MTTTPPPAGDSAPAPNGQPSGLPPAHPQSDNGTQGNEVAASTGPNSGVKLTEAQISRIAELINAGEMDQATLARSKAKSPRVKAFAGKMLQHHGRAKTEQEKLAKQLDITAAGSAAADELKSAAEKTLSTLRTTPAADFDATYMDSRVTGHEKALAAIDEQLLPSAQSAGVVRALRLGRDAVAAHLAEAKEIRAELGKTPPK